MANWVNLSIHGTVFEVLIPIFDYLKAELRIKDIAMCLRNMYHITRLFGRWFKKIKWTILSEDLILV